MVTVWLALFGVVSVHGEGPLPAGTKHTGTPSPTESDLQAGIDAYNRGDYQTALQEWRPLAEQGLATAQFKLGMMYATGWGVEQDDAEAVKWWRLAAEQGDSAAQFNLGLMYGAGRGVPRDDIEAIKWYHRAANKAKCRTPNSTLG